MNWDKFVGAGLAIKWLLHVRGRRVQLHRINKADELGCFHTHPAKAVRIILWGGYTEELEDGTFVEWKPGNIGLVRPSFSHRIHKVDTSYSLWIRGRVTTNVELRGDGWSEKDLLNNFQHPSLKDD